MVDIVQHSRIWGMVKLLKEIVRFKQWREKEENYQDTYSWANAALGGKKILKIAEIVQTR